MFPACHNKKNSEANISRDYLLALCQSGLILVKDLCLKSLPLNHFTVASLPYQLHVDNSCLVFHFTTNTTLMCLEN